MSIVVYSKAGCTECARIKNDLEEKGIDFEAIQMEDLDQVEVFRLRSDARKNRQVAMPLIYVDGEFIRTPVFEEKFIKEAI